MYIANEAVQKIYNKHNLQVFAGYNVPHRSQHQIPQLSIVSFNGRYSEFLFADYTGTLWYFLWLSYKSTISYVKILKNKMF